MNEKVKRLIPKLERLNDEQIDLMIKAADSCIFVQNLNALKTEGDLTKLLAETLASEVKQ